MKHTYKLGPLPWDEDLLKQAYARDFIETMHAIEEHPGFAAHYELEALQMSLEVFEACVSDLIQCCENFRLESRSPHFWSRPWQGKRRKLELSIWRGVFASSSSALALVDHTRKIKRLVHVEDVDYRQRRAQDFDEQEHEFVQGLRNCYSHSHMVNPDSQTNVTDTGKEVRFLLHAYDLLRSKNWSGPAKQYLKDHPHGVDVEKLFENYRSRVQSFQRWFHEEATTKAEPDLSEFRRYKTILRRIEMRCYWNMLLSRAIQLRLNPNTFLDRHLSEVELKMISGLPGQSKIRVDRIIEILDDCGACDSELRETAYKAFGVISED